MQRGTCAHGKNQVATTGTPAQQTGNTATTSASSNLASTTTPAKVEDGGGGLSTSDKIAIGIGVPAAVFTDMLSPLVITNKQTSPDVTGALTVATTPDVI